jgi:hypothetical protein
MAFLLLAGVAVAVNPSTTMAAPAASTAAPTSVRPTVVVSSQVPSLTPTPTPTPAASTSVVPTSVKPTVVVEPVQPAPSTSSSKTTSDQVTAAANAALKEGLGVTDYIETCGTVNWACAITDVSAEEADPTVLNVHVQENLTNAEAKTTALYVFNFVGEKMPDLRWVAVYSLTGYNQIQRSEVPMLR